MKKRKYPIRAGWRVGSVVALPLKDNNEHFNLVQTIYQLKCEHLIIYQNLKHNCQMSEVHNMSTKKCLKF